MSARLDDLVEATRDARATGASSERPLSELEREVDTGREGRPFAEALSRPGTSLIAEHKRRSPSAGSIREGTGLRRRSFRPTSAAARPPSRCSPRRRTSAARSRT